MSAHLIYQMATEFDLELKTLNEGKGNEFHTLHLTAWVGNERNEFSIFTTDASVLAQFQALAEALNPSKPVVPVA